MTIPNGTLLAAVDIGSNSFRLQLAVMEHGQIRPTDYFKETVRQGNGLDSESQLSLDAMQRGWDCLARFGERLRGFKRWQVRAVATQTLREAKNRDDFIKPAKAALGFPIDVISGPEEARLIYQGVSHLLPDSPERRLVVDIGGRSTELIVGQKHAPLHMESFGIGSVAWSMRHFGDGQLTAKNFKAAQLAAFALLDEAQATYASTEWDVAYGASGTVGAVADALAANGQGNDQIIERTDLLWLKAHLLQAGHVNKLRLEGLKEDRRPIIGGGVSVLLALFDLLNIEQLHVAQGALRHGVLLDLLDRESVGTDHRAATVKRMMQQFAVDAAQAKRVAKTALHLYNQILDPIEPNLDKRERLSRKLLWAAQLHEVGNLIAHTEAHKHGAYILQHSDALGFAREELNRLGLLVLGSRGKLRKLEPQFSDASFMRKLLCLRLALILCHARSDIQTQSLRMQINHLEANQPTAFTLHCPAAWRQDRPQTLHLLDLEQQAWRKTPFALTIQTD